MDPQPALAHRFPHVLEDSPVPALAAVVEKQALPVVQAEAYNHGAALLSKRMPPEKGGV